MKQLTDILLGFFRESSDESMKRLWAFIIGCMLMYVMHYACQHYLPEKVESMFDTLCLVFSALLGLGVITGLAAKKSAANPPVIPPPDTNTPQKETTVEEQTN